MAVTKMNQEEKNALETENARLSMEAAEQGMVLLENKHNTLPIKKGGKIVLCGQGAVRTVRGGTGSGDPFNGGLSGGGNADVDNSPRFHVHIMDAFDSAGYEIVNKDFLLDYARGFDEQKRLAGSNPMMTFAYPEQKIPEEMAGDWAADCGRAIYVISRNSGEGADRDMYRTVTLDGREYTLGDYLLCQEEKDNLAILRKHFRQLIVVLNTGGVIDLSEVQKTEPDALLLMSQAGQEGGPALLHVLDGTVTPSGRLTDTWAKQYSDYPASATFAGNDGNVEEEIYEEGIFVGYRYFDEKELEVVYPFGYGLSYTSFRTDFAGGSYDPLRRELILEAVVENTGSCRGAQVVQLYVSKPEEKDFMPEKELAAFAKTSILEPGEKETVTLRVPLRELAFFCEKEAAYIVQEGSYILFLGENSRELTPVLRAVAEQEYTLAQLQTKLPLQKEIHEMKGDRREENLMDETLPVVTISGEIHTFRGDLLYDKETLLTSEPLESMTDEELAALCCGSGWGVADENNPVVGSSSESIPGAAGETTHILEEKYGVPSIILADGPAGIRVRQDFEATDLVTGEKIPVMHHTTAWPVGTLLAQSFDEKLLEKAGHGMALEMKNIGVHILLGPGMNIHRDPLCGRNFEYYSEDPLLSGKMAAAMVRGIQSLPGTGACIKHYAGNNQETNRNRVDTVVGQRALREIYLKGFEIAVRESDPVSIMTSYNLINGVPTADSRDLCTDIARTEWGFRGIIMTDWNGGSSTPSKSMHAGNDLIMPGGEIRALNILQAMKVVEPEFEANGQVRMRSVIPGAPMYQDSWNSFIPCKNGSSELETVLGEGFSASEAADGRILVNGEEIYMKATDRMEFFKHFHDGVKVPSFCKPVTAADARVGRNGGSIIYRGEYKKDFTISRKDVQQCAGRMLNVIRHLTNE